MAQATNPRACLDALDEYWSPQVVGQVNNQYVKVAKLKGELAWHKHDDEDELFFVVYGNLVIELETGAVELRSGEFFVVPKGTMHNPKAEEECGVLLVETVTTRHTGNVVTPRTKSIEEQLGCHKAGS